MGYWATGQLAGVYSVSFYKYVCSGCMNKTNIGEDYMEIDRAETWEEPPTCDVCGDCFPVKEGMPYGEDMPI